MQPQITSYETLSPSSRVWIYQSSRPFSNMELPEIQTAIENFAQQWVSHNRALKAFAKVYHQRFIVLMVDESQADATGCSIDSSVHFLQQLGAQLGVDLFDRMTFAWKDGEEVKVAPKSEFSRLYQEGKLTDETLVFDNLVKDKSGFENEWLKPLGKSWHRRMV